MHLWNAPIIHTIGYGQLSISGTPQALTSSNAAGVWAVLGMQADVDKSKTSGLETTAAVVANSFIASDAVYAHSIDGRGVYGHSTTQQGVVGESDANEGLTAITHNKAVAALSAHNPGGQAGYFEGDVKVTGQLAAETVVAHVDIVLVGGDCAEEFDLAPSEGGEPGTVMVVDEAQRLSACAEAYDQRVAGVIAGAGEYSPGLILDHRKSTYERRPIALLGKAYCKVDAAYGPIQLGDLLTTSPNPGHAMKASDRSRALGATIGKALCSFSEGTGLIPILVCTQ